MHISVVNFFLISLKLSILVNLTTAGELGESACRYFGEYDTDNKKCHEDVVKIKYLPEECTAYVYDGILYNADFEITPHYYDFEIQNINSLLERKPNNVFVFYRRANMEEWHDAIFTIDHSDEVKKVKDFVEKYPVGGLILHGIENVFLPSDGDFYKSFSAYVNAFKTEMPDLKIGFHFNATEMISKCKDPAWFDFGKMNADADFYIIEFSNFNSCTDELLHSGITPLVSKNPDVNTLTKFAVAFNGSTIAKDKVFLEFLITPSPKPEKLNSLLRCEISYNEYCENVYDNTWCVDNQDTLYEKGQFAKLYAKGFIVRDIDLIDRDLKCKCNDNKYITFYMLLNGYNGAEKITCDRLKG